MEEITDLTIVIPYFNPGPVLSTHIADLVKIMDISGLRYEIIAVSDGSSDGSQDSIRDLYPGILKNIELPRNYGKGHAVRVGLGLGSGRYLGFIDGDGDIPAINLTSIIELVKTSKLDMIVGSKLHPDSEVFYPFLRRAYSWGYQRLVNLLFSLPVVDTQTGIKFARSDLIRSALPLMVEERFAFDLELLVIAKKLGYKDVIEVPVVIRRRLTSTVSIKAVVNTLADTIRVFFRSQFFRAYDH